MSVSFEEAMSTLCAMFSDVDKEVVSLILHQNRGHMERTVECLLAMTGGGDLSQPPHPQALPQANVHAHSQNQNRLPVSSSSSLQPQSQPAQFVPPALQYPAASASSSAAVGYPIPSQYFMQQQPVPGLPAGFYAPGPVVPYPPHPHAFNPSQLQPVPQPIPPSHPPPPPPQSQSQQPSLLPHDFLRPPSYFRSQLEKQARRNSHQQLHPQQQHSQPSSQQPQAVASGAPSSSSSSSMDAELARMLQDEEFMQDLAENPDRYLSSVPSQHAPAAASSSSSVSAAHAHQNQPSASNSSASAVASSSSSSMSSMSSSSVSSSSSVKQQSLAEKWGSLTSGVRSKLSLFATKFKRDKESKFGSISSSSLAPAAASSSSSSHDADDAELAAQPNASSLHYQALQSLDDEPLLSAVPSHSNSTPNNKSKPVKPAKTSSSSNSASSSSSSAADGSSSSSSDGAGRFIVEYDDDGHHDEDYQLEDDDESDYPMSAPLTTASSSSSSSSSSSRSKFPKRKKEIKTNDIQLQELRKPLAADQQQQTPHIPDL